MCFLSGLIIVIKAPRSLAQFVFVVVGGGDDDADDGGGVFRAVYLRVFLLSFLKCI